jgi:hypothetical protein
MRLLYKTSGKSDTVGAVRQAQKPNVFLFLVKDALHESRVPSGYGSSLLLSQTRSPDTHYTFSYPGAWNSGHLKIASCALLSCRTEQ